MLRRPQKLHLSLYSARQSLAAPLSLKRDMNSTN
jgi:hypothetical protein